MTHSQFQSSRLEFEKDFRLIPNHWVTDSRLSHCALRVLLYVHQQSPEWLSSPEQIREALATTVEGTGRQRAMGKDAFQAAVRTLVTTGYLEVQKRREKGKWASNRYIVRDPGRQPQRAVSEPLGPEPVFPATVDDSPATAVDNNLELALDPVDNPPEPVLPEPVLPWPENPAVNQEEINKKKRSSSVLELATEAVNNSRPASDRSQDDDDDVEFSEEEQARDRELRAIHPKLSYRALLDRLHRGGKVVVEAIDVVHAALTIVNRSKRPVADPVAYVGFAIEQDPGSWLMALPRAHDPDPSGPSRCDRDGHSWSGPFHEYCLRCETFRPGWQDDRDAAMAELDKRRGVLA